MKNKAWIYFSSTTTTFVCLVISVASGVIAARLLGPSGRGELVVIQYYPAMMGAIFCLAIPQALTYFILREPDHQSQTITAGIHLSLLLGIAGALLFAVVAPLWLPHDQNSELAKAVVIACLAAPAMVITPHLDAINWGLKKFGWCNALRIAGAVGYAVGLIVLWIPGFLTALSAALVGLLIQTALFFAHMGKLGFHHVVRIVEPKTYRLCILQGMKFFLPVLSILIFSLADRSILIKTTTIIEIGYYAVAFAIAYPVSLAVEAFAQVLFVEIADEEKNGLTNSLAAQRFRVAQVIVFVSVIILMPLSPYINRFAFGRDYGPAVPVGFALIGAMALRGLVKMLDFALRARNVTQPSTTSSLIALGVLIVLSVWWVPKGGVTSFALALLTAELIRGGLVLIAFKREFGIATGDLWGLKGDVIKDMYSGALSMVPRLQRGPNYRPVRIIGQSMRQALPRSLKSYLHWQRQLYGVRSFRHRDLEHVFSDICRQIDVERIRALWEEVKTEYYKSPEDAPKYADHEYWLRLNIVRAVKLDLHRKKNVRILDLGSGPAYFLRVAKYFGHDSIGVDLPTNVLTRSERRIFTEIPAALSCSVDELSIEQYKPLRIEGLFDLITGFLVCFNNHKQENEWPVAAWRFFVGDARDHLTSSGSLFLQLNENRQRYGKLLWYDEQMLAFFRSVGKVSRNHVRIQR